MKENETFFSATDSILFVCISQNDDIPLSDEKSIFMVFVS